MPIMISSPVSNFGDQSIGRLYTLSGFCLLLSVVIWIGTKQMASTLSFFMGDFIERKSTGKM